MTAHLLLVGCTKSSTSGTIPPTSACTPGEIDHLDLATLPPR